MTDEQQAWQALLDQAAYFNVLAVPNWQQPNVPTPVPGQSSSLAGALIHGIKHRFDVTGQQPQGRLQTGDDLAPLQTTTLTMGPGGQKAADIRR